MSAKPKRTPHDYSNRWKQRTATLRKRDGDDCWLASVGECLCPAGPRIDFGLHRNHRWAASHDHVVPRALHGSDALKNLKLAHRHCNSSRIVPGVRIDLPQRERDDVPRGKLAVGVFRTTGGYETRDFHNGPPRVIGQGDTIEAAWNAYRATGRRSWLRPWLRRPAA